MSSQAQLYGCRRFWRYLESLIVVSFTAWINTRAVLAAQTDALRAHIDAVRAELGALRAEFKKDLAEFELRLNTRLSALEPPGSSASKSSAATVRSRQHRPQPWASDLEPLDRGPETPAGHDRRSTRYPRRPAW